MSHLMKLCKALSADVHEGFDQTDSFDRITPFSSFLKSCNQYLHNCTLPASEWLVFLISLKLALYLLRKY